MQIVFTQIGKSKPEWGKDELGACPAPRPRFSPSDPPGPIPARPAGSEAETLSGLSFGALQLQQQQPRRENGKQLQGPLTT